jgi:IS30 family transposase
MRSMARLLGHAPSTHSREINRNGGYDRYRAAVAEENAWRRGRRPKGCKLASKAWLRRTVASESDWSPEQIAGWLKRTYPEDEHYQMSHETIYRSLYVQARGVLKKELVRHLRLGERLANRHRRFTFRWPRPRRRTNPSMRSKRTMRRPRRAGDKLG